MKAALAKFLPPGAIDFVFPFLNSNSVHLKITNQRTTKNGDYRPPLMHPNHRISVNGSLNAYAFLITLVHEMAHLEVWKTTKSLENAHGIRWKNTFVAMMTPLIQHHIFPNDIQQALIQHLKNPKAASTSDKKLMEVLHRYNKKQATLLKDIPENSIFVFNGRRFRKLQKLRTYYLCESLDDHKKYRVSGMAEIAEAQP